jgi:hypothetical protein
MGDETWFDNSEPKPKWHLMERCHTASTKNKKFKSQLEKLWLQTFCYEKDVILKTFLPGGLQ